MNAQRDRADARFRLAVYGRFGRTCLRCGEPATEVAHVIRRGYSRTRCDVSNGRPLCSRCHVDQTLNRWHMRELTGNAEFQRLWDLAHQAFKCPRDWWESMPCDTTPVAAETGREQ